MFDRLVFTSEHARNTIPPRYRGAFPDASGVLAGHRGYDAGALWVARRLAREFDVPLFAGAVSRLLVDLNRSVGHRKLFSEFVRELDDIEKARLLQRYYHPYRNAIDEAIRWELRSGGRVLHLSVHSFTPVLDGEVRTADLSFLYDPSRPIELQTAGELVDRVRRADPGLRVRRNYPYRGTADGLTTHLRRALHSVRYAGVEIEMNQACLVEPKGRRRMVKVLVGAIRGVVV